MRLATPKFAGIAVVVFSVAAPLCAASYYPEQSDAFRLHLEETRRHVSKIVGLLQAKNVGAETETCKVVDGLATEASDTIKDVTEPSIRDIALIGAAQQVSISKLPSTERCVIGPRSWVSMKTF